MSKKGSETKEIVSEKKKIPSETKYFQSETNIMGDIENYFGSIQKDIGSIQNYRLFRDRLNKKRKQFSLNSVIIWVGWKNVRK